MEELWTMSKKELDRAGVLARVVERRLSQEKAATVLGISTRQVRRLLRAYQAQGASGLVSRRRGKPSNRRFADGYKERVVGLVRERYADFGPTLAQEKLREEHGVVVSAETLRKWMTEDGLWLARKERHQVQQPR